MLSRKAAKQADWARPDLANIRHDSLGISEELRQFLSFRDSEPDAGRSSAATIE